ncbi:MAG: hypothetical protein AABM29_06515 [Actinomycetota bacterium]
MVDAEDVRHDASSPSSQDRAAERAEELERKTKDLEVFRDAGVLTEAELEEQKAKARWA